MRIANPLYDHAFKFLMSNNRLAKKVISTILDEKILKLELGQQEFVKHGSVRGLKVFRLDFKATILKADGSREKVMIELQKSKLPTNIYRFRQYLGGLYADNTAGPEIDHDVNIIPESLPIIAVYILGYPIDDLPFLATRIDREIVDISTGKNVENNSTFIQSLTHKSYILQVNRLPKKRKTKIEQFLQLFDQACVSDKKFILELKHIPKEFSDIAEYLKKPLNRKDMVRQLTVEEEMEMYLKLVEAEKKLAESELEEVISEKEQAIADRERAIAEIKQAVSEKEQAVSEKEQAVSEKEQAVSEKEQAVSEKEQAVSEKEQAVSEKEQAVSEKERAVSEKEEAEAKRIETLNKLAAFMLNAGIPINEIAAETGLSIEEIELLRS